MIASLLPAFGTPAGELARAGLLLVAFGLVLLISETWHRRASPPVEWTRKLVHLGFGVLAVPLPWLIASPWTVLGIAALAVGPILWARRRGLLPSLFGVERASRGEVYFPIGVVLLFLVGSREPVFYVISLFTLVVCDSLAAVLGQAYGRHQYLVTSDRRSLEGSAVFLFSAFVGIQLPLLLMTDIERGACVLIALQLALLITSFEAIGAGGSDNLTVPLATYYLLVKLTPRPVESVSLQLAVQLSILLAMLLVARYTRFLTFSGAIAAHLMLYAAFSLGGPPWIVAPALALAAAILIEGAMARASGWPAGGYHVRVIYYVSIVAVLLIFADNSFSTLVPGPLGLTAGHPFHALYVGALAGPVAIVSYWTMESMPRVRKRSWSYRALASASLGYATVAPLGLWAMSGEQTRMEFVTAALVCAGGLLLYLGLRRLASRPRGTIWDLRLLALGVLLATLVVLPFHLHWLGVAAWGFE